MMNKKWHNHELKQKIFRDYETGKFNTIDLARIYGRDRRTIKNWLTLKFGKESQRMKVMLRMRNAKVPTRAMAEYFGVTIEGINTMITRHNKKLSTKLNNL